MIKKQSLEALEAELSRAVFAFEKHVDGLSLHIEGPPNLQEFKEHLTSLSLELTTEIHHNFSEFSTRKEVDSYCVMLSFTFKFLNNLVNSYSEFVGEIFNEKQNPQTNSAISYIYFDPAEIVLLKDYVEFQRGIVQNFIQLASSFKQNFQLKSHDSKQEEISCMNEMVGFIPYLSKLREELHEMCSERKKLKFLRIQRKKLALELIGKGIDLYNSPINIWFETRIETYRELIIARHKKQRSEKSRLTWLHTKNDFLECMMSFDQIKAIGDPNRNPISRKELIRHFSKILNIQKITDSESRITKLINRNNPIAFLDRLCDKMKSLKNKK